MSSPLTEEPQAEATEASANTSSSSGQPATKVKSADTNVRVSLKIVNEVEGRELENEKLDIVDEELANMAVAESLNDIPAEAGEPVEVEDFEDNTEDTAGEEGDDEGDEEDGEDDAVVVTLPLAQAHPGTPISNSERSSQTSATSSNSTKQLLPANRSEQPRIERSESVEDKNTPVQSESKIVMVVPQDDDENADNEEFC